MTWGKRDITKIKINEIEGASLASNIVTIPAESHTWTDPDRIIKEAIKNEKSSR